MPFGYLRTCFQSGFRMSVHASLRFSTLSVEGGGIVGRLVDHLQAVGGSAFARKAVGRKDRWRVTVTDNAAKCRAVDAAYWESYQPSDDLTRFEAMKEGVYLATE